MSDELSLQRMEHNDVYLHAPFSHSVLAAVARARLTQNANRIAELASLELAVAAGRITLESLPDTSDLL